MPKIREDLLPGSPKSNKLIKMIRDRFDLSWKTYSQSFPKWDEIEQHYRAFRELDDDDRDSLDKNQVQKIVVPIQFATLQTIMTFLMEVFTALPPVLKTRGADPASVHPANIMEICLDYDWRGNKGYFLWQQWFMNILRYGYCPFENSWGRKVITKKVLKPSSKGSGEIELEGIRMEIPGAPEYAKDYFTVFEGNRWRVVDPRQFYPDPRYPLSRFQDGEFCGRREQIHSNELRKLEDQGLYFNTTKISTSTYGATGTTPNRDADFVARDNMRDRISPQFSFAQDLANARKNLMHVEEMIVVEISPKDYELGDSDKPEDWIFSLIDGTTICRAEESPFTPRFPWEVGEAYPDILAYVSQGVMELTQPLADHLSFLFNSHMANVRKAINDMFIGDPSRVDLRDILDPRAGKFIRLLPRAYGQDPATVVRQFSVTDVTRGHIEDSKLIMELWQRIVGLSDQMFGQISSSKRVAFELQGVMKGAGARMKMMADLISSEAIAPLTEQMALLRQENMSMVQFMEIAGRSAAQLGVRPEEVMNGFVKIRRDHLNGVFYFPAQQGVMPQDRAQAAQILEKVFETVARFPFLAQVFDPVSIFKETIRQYGIHNLEDFLNSPQIQNRVQILPDDEVRNRLAKGMLQPVGQPDQGVRDGREGLNIEGAIDGAGRTRDQRTVQG